MSRKPTTNTSASGVNTPFAATASFDVSGKTDQYKGIVNVLPTDANNDAIAVSCKLIFCNDRIFVYLNLNLLLYL